MWPTCAWLLKVQSDLFCRVWRRLFLFSHWEHCRSAARTGVTQERWENTLLLHQLHEELQPHRVLSSSCLSWPTSLACQCCWNREKPLISEQDDVAAALQYSARTVGCVSMCTSTPAMQIYDCSYSFNSIGNGGGMFSCAWMKW